MSRISWFPAKGEKSGARSSVFATGAAGGATNAAERAATNAPFACFKAFKYAFFAACIAVELRIVV
jgi:hypothetical protein